MAEVEDKQETIREFKPLSCLIGGTRNNLAKVAKNVPCIIFDLSLTFCAWNPFTPFSIMLLTGPTYPVANRLAKNEFFVELVLWAKHLWWRACLSWNCVDFYYLMTICGYWCLRRTHGLLQGKGFYPLRWRRFIFWYQVKKSYRPIAFGSLEPIIKRALCILFCRCDSVFLIGWPCGVWCHGLTHNRSHG